MKTIAIMNNKGGVGKTVTAINLADILVADYAQRVVLVDCDGQANLTRFFLPGADKLALVTTADVLRGDCEPLWSDNLVPIQPGLDLLPSSSDLYELDLQAIKDGVSAPERLRHFAEAAAADSEVDWMIFDCPPGYTLASVAALLSVREVMIPALADKFSLDGVFAVTAQLRGLSAACPGLRSRVLLTQTRSAEVVGECEQLLRSQRVPLYRTKIRRTDKVPESTVTLSPMREYSPRSSAAIDYRCLAGELMEEV